MTTDSIRNDCSVSKTYFGRSACLTNALRPSTPRSTIPLICWLRIITRSGDSARGLVPIKATFLIRSGACRNISNATIPPIENPTNANSAGASSSTLIAIDSIESQPEKSATITSLCRIKNEICCRKSCSLHSDPGNSNKGNDTNDTPKYCVSSTSIQLSCSAMPYTAGKKSFLSRQFWLFDALQKHIYSRLHHAL